MIEITADHEEIARHIVKSIAGNSSHFAGQQSLRQHFTNPYRLHEYDLALKLLIDFDVIRRDNGDRLIPGTQFYTYKNLGHLYESKVDWKFWAALSISVFSAATAFYFGYTNKQKSNAIEELKKLNKAELSMTDSLLRQVHHLDSLTKMLEMMENMKIPRQDSIIQRK